jgi:hypothetical protein
MRTINNKKRNKINSTFSFSSDLKICHECGSKRNIVKFEDMPKLEQEAFQVTMTIDEFKESSSFVYCPYCGDYSIVSGIPTWYKMK